MLPFQTEGNKWHIVRVYRQITNLNLLLSRKMISMVIEAQQSDPTSAAALRNDLMTTWGWTPSSMYGLACFKNSPASNTTDVVPSPTCI